MKYVNTKKLTPEVKRKIEEDIMQCEHPITIAKKYDISLPLLYSNFKIEYRKRKNEELFKKIVELRKKKYYEKEISKMCGISEAAVRRRIREALQKGLINFKRIKKSERKMLGEVMK